MIRGDFDYRDRLDGTKEMDPFERRGGDGDGFDREARWKASTRRYYNYSRAPRMRMDEWTMNSDPRPTNDTPTVPWLGASCILLSVLCLSTNANERQE